MEYLPAQLVITSVGYQCESISHGSGSGSDNDDIIPFDHNRYIIPSRNGRVISNTTTATITTTTTTASANDNNHDKDDDKDDDILTGLYVSGKLY